MTIMLKYLREHLKQSIAHECCVITFSQCSYRVLSYKKLCMQTLRALFQLAKVKPAGLHTYTLHIDEQLEIIKAHC